MDLIRKKDAAANLQKFGIEGFYILSSSTWGLGGQNRHFYLPGRVFFLLTGLGSGSESTPVESDRNCRFSFETS